MANEIGRCRTAFRGKRERRKTVRLFWRFNYPEEHKTKKLPGGARAAGREGAKELCLLMRICSQDDKTLPVEYTDPGTLQEGPSRSLQRTLKRIDRRRKQVKAQQTRGKEQITDLENS